MTWNMLTVGSVAPIDGFLTWLVQSTVLLTVGLLAGRLLRRRGPAVQSTLYRTCSSPSSSVPSRRWRSPRWDSPAS